MRPILCGHRGAAGLAPENSLSGIDCAIRHGMDAIEIDVRCSLDHVPVLMHDANFGRTTGVSRDVDALKWKDIRSLPLGANESVPRLIDALDRMRGHAIAVLDVKPHVELPPILEAIRYAGAERDVIFMSFQRSLIDTAAAEAPNLRCGLIAEGGDVAATLDGMHGIPIVSCDEHCLSPKLLHHQHRLGLQVWAWTVNDGARIRELAEWGVDAIISDYPDRLQRIFDGD